MCKAVTEYAEKYAKGREAEGGIKKAVKTVSNLLKKGMSLETALECVELDRETYEKYAESVQ